MSLRIALFGQAAFGKDVFDRLRAGGHEIVGVFAPPEGRRPDPLAAAAGEVGVPLLRPRFFRRKSGEAIPARVEEHAALGADLNVLAYVTAFVPIEILDAPPRASLCFHPSLLPEYRGGSAIPWQIILGAREAGVTVFRPDSGVDTGPIVVQKGGVQIGPEDTAGSLYFQKLYPLGVEALVEAVARVASGRAEPVAQDETAASFQGLVDDTVARIDWSVPAPELDRLIRGCDPQPGAHALREQSGEPVRLFDARLDVGEDSGAAAPGTVLEPRADRARVAARGGVISFARARVADAAKVSAPESGLREGERLI
jgi:methionyl-tRNA formyltransferase